MEKEFEAILVEFDALWGGADANSHKQITWRKELVARLVKASQHRVYSDVCADCGSGLAHTDKQSGAATCSVCGSTRRTRG